MAMLLTCSCGTRFEVEETFAGQSVSCPDCEAAVAVPVLRRAPVQTSAWAIASTILALTGAITVVGTLLAVIVGVVALRRIAGRRDRLGGAGYALFGIVAGLIFTGLTIAAYSAYELFGVGDGVRERMMAGQVDRSGPLEIVRAHDGFAITRPSPQWGTARPELAREVDDQCNLLLVNAAKDLYVAITAVDLAAQTLEQYGDHIVSHYRDRKPNEVFADNSQPPMTGFRLRERRRLPATAAAEATEIFFDIRIAGQPMTFIYRTVKGRDRGRGFDLRAWGGQRRFGQVEAELRRLLDSFRLLP